MRIALVSCSADEVLAIRVLLGDEPVDVGEGLFAAADFEIAIVGRALLGKSLDIPAIYLLTSRDEYAMAGGDLAVLSVEDLERLPYVIRRELESQHQHLRARRIEESLLRREMQLSVAQQMAKMGGWEWDISTDEMNASPELLRLVRAAGAGPVTMEAWMATAHPLDVEALRKGLLHSLDTGEPFEHRFRAFRVDGAARYIEVRAKVERDAEGRPVRMVGMSRDITDEMLNELALRSSEERYRTLVEQAKDIIFALDAEGCILSVNRAFTSLTGWAVIERIGRKFIDLVDPDTAALAEQGFARVLAGGQMSPHTEHRLRTKSGEWVTIEATAQLAGSKEMPTIIGIARDITKRKENEARVEKEKRLASLGQLATSVAHEFNNVLMSIMPFAELLERRFPDDAHVTAATKHISQAIRRGREISQEILRFARPVRPIMKPLSISEWLADFGPRIGAMLGPTISLETRLGASDGDLFIRADRGLLEQAVTNLALNARDAMANGGVVTIDARPSAERGFVEISIADQGSGIPEHLLDRIFEPLFTTKRDGNGLGLTVAHQAIQQQEGSLAVRSTVGLGSTFTMTLRATEATPKDSATTPTLGRKILIVEDDESVGEGLRALLSDEGFDVRLIARGLESSDSIAEFEPDLVLLDVNLPDISGIEVYDRIRATWPELPVVLSTGHADARSLEGVRGRNVLSIMKPYDISELLAVMSQATR